MTMEDQTAAFLSTLSEMKSEEVRKNFLDLFAQALAIEHAEAIKSTEIPKQDTGSKACYARL